MSFKKLIIVLSLSLVSSSCSTKNLKINSNEIIEDQKGIVSLTSLTSDIIYTLKPDELIGIPGSSILRENESLKNIPTISEGRNPPNIEKIISLNPKLVIGSDGFHDKTLTKLNELGINVLSTKVNSWNDLISLVENLSTITKENSQKVFEKLNSCFIEASPKDKKVVVLVSTKPLLSPNNKSWAGSLLERFNLKNLTANLEGSGRMKGYLNLSPEWLIKEEPDNLILIRFGDEQYNQYSNLPFWNNLKAVKNNKINYFNYYGLINVGSLNSINKTCEKLESL